SSVTTIAPLHWSFGGAAAEIGSAHASKIVSDAAALWEIFLPVDSFMKWPPAQPCLLALIVAKSSPRGQGCCERGERERQGRLLAHRSQRRPFDLFLRHVQGFDAASAVVSHPRGDAHDNTAPGQLRWQRQRDGKLVALGFGLRRGEQIIVGALIVRYDNSERVVGLFRRHVANLFQGGGRGREGALQGHNNSRSSQACRQRAVDGDGLAGRGCPSYIKPNIARYDG